MAAGSEDWWRVEGGKWPPVGDGWRVDGLALGELIVEGEGEGCGEVPMIMIRNGVLSFADPDHEGTELLPAGEGARGPVRLGQGEVSPRGSLDWAPWMTGL